MIETLTKAFLGISIILTGWLLVQVAWRRVFPGTPPGEDPLAGRLGCHNCSCQTPCDGANRDAHGSASHKPNHPGE